MSVYGYEYGFSVNANDVNRQRTAGFVNYRYINKRAAPGSFPGPFLFYYICLSDCHLFPADNSLFLSHSYQFQYLFQGHLSVIHDTADEVP